MIPTRLKSGPRAVRTSALTKRFGDQTALSGLDMEVPEGAVYVLVGPNGAGKTTTLRILLDLLRPDRGAAEVFGLDTASRSEVVRARVGYVPERHAFHYGWMEVRDLVQFHAAYHTAWDTAYARELAERLDVRMEKKFARLSKGEARRVQLLLALAHRPPLLVMDEPTDGLDPVGRNEVLGLIADHLAAVPTTVLVSTHLVYEAERLADHLAVMEDGRLTAQLARDDLRARLRRYLVELPEEDEEPEGLTELEVLDLKRAGRELELTVWGEEERVADRLRAEGATLRDVSSLSLEDAALALLTREPAA